MALSFPFAMDRNQQKRNARHLRSKQRRFNQFVSLYVMNKHKNVYDEAKMSYDDLDAKYPDKRDLTKTDEFTYAMTGYTSAYQARQARKKKQQSNNAKVMEIQVNLMSKDDVAVASNLAIPDNVYNDILAEISQDPIMSGILNDTINEQDPIMSGTLNNTVNEQELQDILPPVPDITELEKELNNMIYQ